MRVKLRHEKEQRAVVELLNKNKNEAPMISMEQLQKLQKLQKLNPKFSKQGSIMQKLHELSVLPNQNLQK